MTCLTFSALLRKRPRHRFFALGIPVNNLPYRPNSIPCTDRRFGLCVDSRGTIEIVAAPCKAAGKRLTGEAALLLLIAGSRLRRLVARLFASQQIASMQNLSVMLVEPTLVVGKGFQTFGMLIDVHSGKRQEHGKVRTLSANSQCRIISSASRGFSASLTG